MLLFEDISPLGALEDELAGWLGSPIPGSQWDWRKVEWKDDMTVLERTPK